MSSKKAEPIQISPAADVLGTSPLGIGQGTPNEDNIYRSSADGKQPNRDNIPGSSDEVEDNRSPESLIRAD